MESLESLESPVEEEAVDVELFRELEIVKSRHAASCCGGIGRRSQRQPTRRIGLKRLR